MIVQTPRDIGALVRDRRRSAGMSQDALAASAEVSRRWLAALEAGKSSVEMGMVLRVLSAVGVALEVIEGTGPATPDGRRASSVGSHPPIDLDALVAEYERPR